MEGTVRLLRLNAVKEENGPCDNDFGSPVLASVELCEGKQDQAKECILVGPEPNWSIVFFQMISERDSMEPYSKKILEIKNAIEEIIQELGDKETRNMLHSYFFLSANEAYQFVELVDKLKYYGIPHDALPSPWFFEEHTSTSTVDLCKVSLREFAPIIRDQKREIIYAIRMFRSLEEEQKSIAIEKWPEEYRKSITKEVLKLDDDCDDSDGEEPSHNADDIADRILAKRWKSTPNTIKKYSTKKIANQVGLSPRFQPRQRKTRLGRSVRAGGKRFRRVGNLRKPSKAT